ncbi:hypothetical protein CR513_26768, partial [Mucuna pruriens]
MEELLGTLKVHEIELNEYEGQRKGKSITLKAQKAQKGSSSKAFKVEESNEEASKEEGSNKEEHSFISRKIHSMYTKEVKDKSQVMCYEDKKPRHFKSKHPSLKKEKEKEKKNFLQEEERSHGNMGGP